jgi:MFS family permease
MRFRILSTFHIFSSIFFLNGIAWRGAPMLLSIHAGRISDRHGLPIPVMFGTAALALAAVIPVFELRLGSLLLSAILFGLGQLFVQVAIHNGIGSISAPEVRAINFARLQVVGSLAALCGPLIVGVAVDHSGLKAGFGAVWLGAVAIVLPAVLFTIYKATSRETLAGAPEKSAMDLLRYPGFRRTLFTSAVAVCGLELFAFYIPIYGTAIGLSATLIGAVLAANATAAFLVRAMIGSVLRRVSEVTVLATSMILGSISFALIPLFGSAEILFVSSILLGLSLGLAAPLTQAMAYSNSPAGRTGEALGLRLLVNKAMQVAVPLAFGSMGAAFGVGPVFWANAAILLTGGIVSGRRGRSVPKV